MDPGTVIVGIDSEDRALDALTLAHRFGDVLGSRVVEVAVETGSPARGLQRAAEEEAAAVIVLGATRHAVRGCVALGTTAERLLSGAPCPVAVAPRGYANHSWPPRFGRIGAAFVPTAEGHSAARIAGSLAERCGTAVRLLEVADPHVWARDAWAGRAQPDELAAAQADVIERHLSEVQAELPGASTARMLVGDPAEQLREQSADLDLLVCGSRDYGAISGVAVGGVAKVLMHGATCPVMVVPRALC